MITDEPIFCPESVNRSLPRQAGFETMPEFDIVNGPEIALLSEPSFAEDWNRPEEDEAWSHLKSDFTDYLSNLEDYEDRLAHGEIQW